MFRSLPVWYIEQTAHRQVRINNLAFVHLKYYAFYFFRRKTLKMEPLSLFTYKLKQRDYTPAHLLVETYHFNTYPHEK